MTPPSLPLREILLCEAFHEDSRTLIYAVVLRKGLSFELLDVLRGDPALIARHETTLELLERRFKLPVRVLDGSESAFLGVQTMLAHKNGTKTYRLRAPKRPQPC